MEDRLVEKTPGEFGLVHWRWICHLPGTVLRGEKGFAVTGETACQHLPRPAFVPRGPDQC
ncbi:MAG: hypothetical protein NZ899_07845 [Thermoguttaceae bacterium]|nr:hypothetical protein [Thermoguttaceae bacterium]MDW8079054.1 hypothetical protein [Thermoguttaceae bacterium]